MIAYTEADYGVDHMDQKSRSGYVLYFNNGLVAWGSKKQSCVATSTTHVEYIALYIVTKGLVMQAIGGSRVCSNRAYGYLH